MEEKKKEEKIGEALLKVALGYQVAEVTEEYAEVDGKLKLTKRKKTKKDIPPDLKAVQLLLSNEDEGSLAALSDEALETEKARLLTLLQQESGQTESAVKKRAVKKTAVKTAVFLRLWGHRPFFKRRMSFPKKGMI